MSTIEVRIPGRVWEDAIPQSQLGLGAPQRQPKGRGWTAVYENVPTEVALEVAEYLRERADNLGASTTDPRERELYRIMRHTAWVTMVAARTTVESAASA